MSSCRHCGSPITDSRGPAGFCCTGCAAVHDLIESCGLEKYYDLRGGVIAPVAPALLEPKDYSWLRARMSAAEAAAGPAEIRLGLRGVSCIGCVWLIEKLFAEQPGAIEAAVNPHAGFIRLRWARGACDLVKFADTLRGFGYMLTPEAPKTGETTGGLVLRLGLCGAFAMNAMLNIVPTYFGMKPGDDFAALFRLLTIGFATLSMAVGASYFIGRAVNALRSGALHMDLPIALGLVAAYLASFVGWFLGKPSLEYWDFVSLFTFLMLVGRWMQERAVEENRMHLPELNPVPDAMPVYADESAASPARTVAVDAVKAGDLLGIPRGGVIPVCGRVVGRDATLSLAWINGEADPVAHPAGRLAPAGAVNIGASEIRILAGEDWSASMLNRLVNAGGEGAFTPKILQRVLSTYLVVVIVVAAAGFLVWGLHAGDWKQALQSAVSVLVVSCPCSIGLAFPLATELAVARLRKGGVYVRDNRVWERLTRVRRVVFDKTGTLTLELPSLNDPDALARLPSAERAALFRLVENNLHPVGRSLRDALSVFPESRPAPDAPIPAVTEIIGRGVSLTDATGVVWFLGKDTGDNAAVRSQPATPNASDAVFTRDGATVARFAFAESARPGAREEIQKFERAGLRVHVLSGDRPEKVATMLAELGLPADRGIGGLSPDAKADWLDANGGDGCLMVGDGANDALAFSRAGLRGTPVVDRGLLEQKADFYLLGRGLTGLGLLFEVAALRARVLRGVFTFAVTYNLIVGGLALAGHMSPLLASILMPGSAILTLFRVSWRMRTR